MAARADSRVTSAPGFGSFGAMAFSPDSVLLTERVAVITGAAAGIGRAIALAFARFGADLALCDRNAAGLEATAGEVRELGRRAFAAVLDVRDAALVKEFFDRAAAELGGIDILVNNAGGGFQAAFLDVNEKGQEALVRENFGSVASCIRAAVPLMPARGGAIINVTSIEAHRAGPGFAIYSAMKAAVANLTRSLALELGMRRIRVNCIAPDVIPTPGIGAVAVKTPLPRAGHVDDVAAAAVYLAAEAMSGFVTGTTLHVDGGNHAAGGWRRRDDGSFTT
jgi:3-oxoacyl-[acyl-carrier protein] reductase